MKLRHQAQQWAFAIVVLMLALHVSAITTRVKKPSSKSKSIEQQAEIPSDEKEAPSTPPEKISERQGLDAEYEQYDDSTPIETSDLAKRTQNVSEIGKADKGRKEESPPTAEVRESTDEGEHLGKVEFSRESRGNKNPRIYYDETAPRFPQGGNGEVPEFENAVRQLKQKDGNRYYYPKNYLNGKHGPRRGHKPSPSNVGISGKRVPDHVSFDQEGHDGAGGQEHDFPAGHAIGIGPEEHEHAHGLTDEAPYHGHGHEHGIEEHGKYKGHVGHDHVSGYGYHHHYGTYRHTIGDKVDAVGKALQVLIPSALLITGVSALFPNRVHVPTTPNKHRQKRSTYYRRARMLPPPPAPMIPPEYEDIPSHILQAEHRIMDGSHDELYPDWGKRQGVAENAGFDPFRVFKGPGPETTMERIHAALPLPDFPNMPDMPVIQHTQAQYVEGDHVINLNGNGPSAPPSTYDPVEDYPEGIPPTSAGESDHIPTTQMSPGMPPSSMEINERAQPAAIMRRRKTTTRKPPIFMKETQKSSLTQRSSESQNYLTKNIKNSLEDIKTVVNPVRAEEEFMASLQNLVTPDIAKALVKNKPQESTPNKFDLSPDGPVMGLLTSYAQHEKESPLCQKRALCELAVKGKGPKSTKFEAFLWSVATLVPDVFSEMYDLQEVFQAIRNERCARFDCPNPNLDLQLK